MKIPKLVPEKDHGKPIDVCNPIVVMARVIRIDSKAYSIETINRSTYQTTGSKTVTVEYEIDKERYVSTEVFEVGEVAPELGQWVRGVVVPNQWFSLHFVTTHMMKKK